MDGIKCWKWLKKFPGYAVNGSQVTIITKPEQFYSTVKEKASTAKQRVCLASLYLGNGSLEQELVSVLEHRLEEVANLKVKVLLDYSRGSRGKENSRKMLLPLIKQSENCQLFLFHSPRLRGFIKKWLPERWNEIIALQHMKIYIFDDTCLMTGANLSNDYFTNRQDRYIMVEGCKDLTDFMENLINEVSQFSFQIDSNDNAHLSSGWKLHPVDGDEKEFTLEAKRRIESLYEESIKGNINRLQKFLSTDEQPTTKQDEDTWIFPLVQMGTFGINYDNEATMQILKEAKEDSKITLATGYFNLPTECIKEIVENSLCRCDILMAHPKANGFYKAKGFAGGIPDMYTLMAKRFYDRVVSLNQQTRISMFEYIRDRWTFHGKGMWYYPPVQKFPSATLIGSPNFGYRSVHRDLETQLYIVTANPDLRKQLHEEQQFLFSFSVPFGRQILAQRDRHVPFWVRLVAVVFKNFF